MQTCVGWVNNDRLLVEQMIYYDDPLLPRYSRRARFRFRCRASVAIDRPRKAANSNNRALARKQRARQLQAMNVALPTWFAPRSASSPDVAGVTFSDSVPDPKFLNPGPKNFQIWESDSCSNSGKYRPSRNSAVFLLNKWHSQRPSRLLPLLRVRFFTIFDSGSGSERKTQNSAGVDPGTPWPPLLSHSRVSAQQLLPFVAGARLLLRRHAGGTDRQPLLERHVHRGRQPPLHAQHLPGPARGPAGYNHHHLLRAAVVCVGPPALVRFLLLHPGSTAVILAASFYGLTLLAAKTFYRDVPRIPRRS